MPSTDFLITRSTPIVRTPRVMQLEGMFDVPPTRRSEVAWWVSLPLDEKPWQIGLIVGPSGSGKSTLAREAFGDSLCTGFDWPADRSIVDAFPAAMSIKEITLLLSSVGFSSPPSWLRPFRVLSNGEQFRVTLARAIAERPERVVIDEFTSVVDRTVAKMGSVAIARAVRRRPGQQFVAVSCHSDVVEWLDPDWIYEPETNAFHWRLERRGRPPIRLEIARVGTAAWRLFARHHYLTTRHHRSAVCFCAFLDGRPAAFCSWLPFVGRKRGKQQARRVHRAVCLPDFQGAGIGSALLDFCGSLWKGLGYRVFLTTAHPALVRRPHAPWTIVRRPSLVKKRDKRLPALRATRAVDRLTVGLEYIGPALDRSLAASLVARRDRTIATKG